MNQTADRAKIVFGIPEKKLQLKGFPDGRIRLRYRAEDFAIATVRNVFGTAQYYVQEKEGFFQPSFVKGVNANLQ